MQTTKLNPASIPLQARLGKARSWADLELLCAHIDAAYLRGELDLASADELSASIAAAALKIPEQPSIPAEALVSRKQVAPHNARQAA